MNYVNNQYIVFDLLIPFEIYSKMNHVVPYYYAIRNKHKELQFFGAEHSHNSSHDQFIIIRKLFEKFNPQFVIIEGGFLNEETKNSTLQMFNACSEEEIIRSFGEPGFVLKLALAHKIPTVCGDPSKVEEYKYLEECGFLKKYIFAFEIFRLIPQFHSQKTLCNLEQFIWKAIRGFESRTRWNDFTYTVEALEKISEELWGIKEIQEKEGFYNPRIYPTIRENTNIYQTVINEISRKVQDFR